MFSNLIINDFKELFNFFQLLNLNLYFTKPQLKTLQDFIVSMMLHGFQGKMTDVSNLTLCSNRTSVGRFLNDSPWNEEYLLREMKSYVIKQIWSHSRTTGLPIYVIVDDTICEKTVPSSKAQDTIYGCSFHQSHLAHKTVYGHQFVTVMLRCGEKILPFTTVLYEKEKKSKIEIVKGILESLPNPVCKGYVLADSWYSCQDIFVASAKSGYYYIGAMKSNRKIYPSGYRHKGIQVGAFAKQLKLSDFDLVTIKGKSYHVYTYLGRINGLKK